MRLCGGIVAFIIVVGIVVGIFSGVGVVGGAWRVHDVAAYQAILSILRQLHVFSK